MCYLPSHRLALPVTLPTIQPWQYRRDCLPPTANQPRESKPVVQLTMSSLTTNHWDNKVTPQIGCCCLPLIAFPWSAEGPVAAHQMETKRQWYIIPAYTVTKRTLLNTQLHNV